jgi:hypothetical protein
MTNRKLLLPALWIFAMLNYLYCDVVGNMDANVLRELLTGEVEGIKITESFLLGASVFMEIPIAMTLLSRILPHRVNRWANVVAATIMTLVQSATLFLGVPTAYYVFFSVIEIGTTAFIAWYAATWRTPAPLEHVQPDASAATARAAGTPA